MFVPYIWIDNTISLPSGREMYGYPKAFGWAVLPDEGAEEDSFGLDVFGMNFGEAPSQRPLIRIERGDHADEHRDKPLNSLTDVGSHLRHVVQPEARRALWPDLHMLAELFQDLRAHRLRQVFLKQIRAIDDGHKAALQQVTQAT